MSNSKIHVLAALGAVFTIGCTPTGDRAVVGGRGAPPVPEVPADPDEAVAILLPPSGSGDLQGEARFVQADAGVRADIVHSHADDGSGTSGNAGRRVACGVIGMAAPI
jgi:hypothetical protein